MVKEWFSRPFFSLSVALLLGCCALMGHPSEAQPTNMQVTPMPAMPTPFSSEEREKLEHDALSGSANAAGRLAGQFALYNDLNQATYWWTIAAENGDPRAMYNLWSVGQMVSNPPMREERRMFWLKRAAEMGYPSAISALDRLNKREK